jgi:hypothetical protein
MEKKGHAESRWGQPSLVAPLTGRHRLAHPVLIGEGRSQGVLMRFYFGFRSLLGGTRDKVLITAG